MSEVEVHHFEVGDRVEKPKGYPFNSTVVAVFQKLDGEVRLVCESHVIPGMLHIFAPHQMVPMRAKWPVDPALIEEIYRGGIIPKGKARDRI